MELEKLRDLIRARRFSELEPLLASEPASALASSWDELSPMERLVAFKMLDLARAADLFDRLPFAHQYFLLCGFPLQSIAPVLEDLPVGQRRCFVQLPADFQERMFRRLASAGAR